MERDFSNLAFAKLNLDFDHELFAKEYDEWITPRGTKITNGLYGVEWLAGLNREWNMVPEDIYRKGDVWVQPGDATTMKYIEREYPCWILTQLMQLDFREGQYSPVLAKHAIVGGTSFRNETLDSKYKFFVKPEFKDLNIVKWIHDNLPFKQINGIHCVTLPEGGFAAIHRDMKGLYDHGSSAGVSKLFKAGFIVVNLNVTSGGVPLYWSLDGKDAVQPYKADDSVYITNDYFLHGVPLCTSRRRQIRVIGIPKPEFWDLIDHNNKVDIGPDYNYQPGFNWV